MFCNVASNRLLALLISALSLHWLALVDANAQVMLSPAFEDTATKPSVKESPSAEADSAFRLTPATQPNPLLQYRFWPAPEDRRGKNAMIELNRAVILASQLSGNEYSELQDLYFKWIEQGTPVEDVPRIKELLGAFEKTLKVLKHAENWMDVRYELWMEEQSTVERAARVLPEFQQMRFLAVLLNARLRVAAIEKRWDDVVDDLRLGFRLSEMVGHSTSLLLPRLIGLAVAETMLDSIQVIIQDPDCPSFYWALVSLPHDQLFRMRDSVEYESLLVTDIGNIASPLPLPGGVMGEQAAVFRIKQASKASGDLFGFDNKQNSSLRLLELATGVYVAMMAEPSRRVLANSSQWQDLVNEMSDAEAVLRASNVELKRIRDQWLTWSLLPHDLRQGYERELKIQFDRRSPSLNMGELLAKRTLPHIDRSTATGLRIKRLHHRLATIEAIRLHVGRRGVLPKTLNNLHPVPAWHDPFTNADFQYRRTTPTTATLTSASTQDGQPDVEHQIKLHGATK